MTDHILWKGDHLDLLDQRRLPLEEVRVIIRTQGETASAIADLVVRGAPAIGIVGAYGMVLAADEGISPDRAYNLLISARPTAVNLKWALDRMLGVWKSSAPEETREVLEKEAQEIHRQDIRLCRAIGRSGSFLIARDARVMTHCNAGSLATGGYGTALGVIRAAFEDHGHLQVLATETRPVLQGARLTAWELSREGIPVSVLPDSASGYLMSRGEVDLVVVGADRVAVSGHVANKIGTYMLAVLARENDVPFYVAMPHSTVDGASSFLDHSIIEERSSQEVTELAGIPVAAPGVGARNPAFDITPPHLVTAFITDLGVVRPPYPPILSVIARGEIEDA